MKKLILLAGVIVLAAAAIAAQCAATTKKGTQCKRQAAAGSLYCWQHGKATSQSTAAVSSSKTDSLVRCKAITKAGTQCKRKPSLGSNYGWQHQGNVREASIDGRYNSSESACDRSKVARGCRGNLHGYDKRWEAVLKEGEVRFRQVLATRAVVE